MRENSDARRTSGAAAFPLAVMAATFVLPTYRSCGDEFHSPAHFASESIPSVFWIASVFVCAAVLAALTFRALWRGEVDRATRRLGLASVAGFALAMVGAGAAQALQSDGEWPWLAAAGVAALVAAVLVRRGRGRLPWQIWENLLAAFAALALATPASVILGGDLLTGHTRNLGPGAYLYLGGLVALWVVLGAAFARRLRR